MSDEMQFSSDELEMLQGMFFEQATEVIDSLGELILRVESDPSDTEALRAVRRAVHTLKGDSTAFGFGELTQLAHHYEDALDRVGARKGTASRELIDLLLAGADALAALISFYRGNGPMPDIEHLMLQLDDMKAAETQGETEVPRVAPQASNADPTTEAVAETPLNEEAKTQPKKTRAKAKTKAKARAAEEAEAAPVVELAVAPAQETVIQPVPAEKEDPAPMAARAAAAGRGENVVSQQARNTTLRVESERIDTTMNLVGELIIQRSMIVSLTAEIEAEHYGKESARRLGEAVALTGRTLSELQESVMRMRLVPIDQVFRRFPRVVRDASIKLGKPLRLEIKGGETEIDKSIVEEISDPLIHLVRNACDHGVESPDVRRAAGKPEEGLITLRARRVGNQIAVEIEDDGAGIDPNRIVAKAIKKNLITEQEVADWTDIQKTGLIFLPGFSTKEQISDMSGRGVGMDVVKTTVDSLGGTVTVTSAVGQGSRFTIKLPLTMAIVRAMLFESVGRRFALPLDSIREITRLRHDEAKTVNGREVLRLRDKVLPLIHIDDALGLRDPHEPRQEGRRFVFVLDLGDGRDVGLAVERLFGEQELVLKSVDDSLTKSEIVAGASILGDGQVVLILDPYATVRQANRGMLSENGAQALSYV